MHEYSLSGINAGLNSDDPIVLCRITYDSSKDCKVDLKSGSTSVGDVTSSSSGVDEKAEMINTSLEGMSSEPTSAIDGGVDDPSTATQQLDGLDATTESISLEDLDIWLSFDNFDNQSEDVGPPVDVDQFMECLNFNPQNELVEENSMSNLGKRKSEAEDNSLRNKKALAFKLSKMRPDENLKLLHSILYGKTIKVHVLKRNIGLFSGFVWDVNEEKQRLKVKERIDKFTKSCSKKEDLSVKLLEFLESPHVTTEILLSDIEKAKKLKRKAKSSKSPRSGRKAVKTASKGKLVTAS
ncbi:hypothetical protein POM88_049766 [Heracleum sosnowskyi]|uniref:Uncharacterized protein n=1 Tax=Heracleum sosnowskyi TaxID=360622 RepID=A0AAD8GWB3_9APIA|nr:hypothetical protein POM88_049766 [Heracleum sosnowskyi]